MTERETFPILSIRGQSFAPVSWALMARHEVTAQRNHDGQTLERLAQRGGLDPCEALAVVLDLPWEAVRLVPLATAHAMLRALDAAVTQREAAERERDDAQRQSHEDAARYMQHMGRADHYAQELRRCQQARQAAQEATEKAERATAALVGGRFCDSTCDAAKWVDCGDCPIAVNARAALTEPRP